MSTDTDINAIEKAIFAALSADTALTTLVPAARHWNMAIPGDTTFPVIVVQLMGSGMEGAGFGPSGGDGEDLDYLVKAVTQGDQSVASAGQIAGAIDTVLQGGTLTATGYSVYGVRRQRRIRYMEYDAARTPYVHAGAVYRLWTIPS